MSEINSTTKPVDDVGAKDVEQVQDVHDVDGPDKGGTEEQALMEIGETEPIPVKIKFNLELLRAVGLLGIVCALMLGTVLTTYVTEWPIEGEPFDFEATFIYELFGFNHTCTMIDFNPSKTVAAALTIIFNVIPLTAFALLNYLRIQHDFRRGRVKQSLATFSKFATPVMTLSFLLFALVYVNFPKDLHSFTLHYIPFFFYQFGMVLMEIQHIHYLLDTGKIPFNIPKTVCIAYYWLLLLFFVWYSAFIWSFIAEKPILDNSQPGQLAFAQFTMYFFMILSTLIPAAFAVYESRDPEISQVILEYTTL